MRGPLDLEPWIWRGLRLQVPVGWELLQQRSEGQGASGQIHFGDAWQLRMELSWREVAAGSMPDPAQLRDQYLEWLKSVNAGDLRAVEYADWRGVAGRAHGQAFTSYCRWFPETRQILELFTWWPRESETGSLQALLLQGCRSAEDPTHWRLYGLDVKSPWPLRSAQFLPALTRLVFAKSEDLESETSSRAARGERLIVERRGMVRQWLAPDMLVATWNRVQVPLGLRRDGGSLEHEDTPCDWISGVPLTSPLLTAARRLWARLRRRPVPAPSFISLACAVPSRNELRRVEYWSSLEPLSPSAAAAQLLPAPLLRTDFPDAFAPTPPLPEPDPNCRLEPPHTWSKLMLALPVKNAAVDILPAPEGSRGLYLSVPNVQPAWYRPPISWFLPRRPARTYGLDALGAELWRQCDGRTPVMEMIVEFAREHQTTFHEARLMITQQLQNLTRWGLIAMRD